MVKDFLSLNKKIYDRVHGFIRFDDCEKELMDSLAFQRLRNIHQLGGAYLVYPGATHSRLEHSLGVMELATNIYDRVCSSVRPDLFHFIPRKDSVEYQYWRKILRLAALCHDLGHPPFSHVAEAELLGKGGHEKWTKKIVESHYLDPLWECLRKRPLLQRICTERDPAEDVIKVALGREKLQQIASGSYSFTSWEHILSQMITGDFLGADQMDYLVRDAKSTGIVFGLFDYLQLMEMLCILPSENENSGGLELGIDEGGLESCEALVLARHFMHKRVYQHSSVKAYNFHLRRFMKNLFALRESFQDLEQFLLINDVHVLCALQEAALDSSRPGHEDARRIFFRRGRFKAIPIPFPITEDELNQFKSKNGLSDWEMEWDLDVAISSKSDFSFPVSRRHQVVQSAKESSFLFSHLPSETISWVYLSPSYELLFLETLKQQRHLHGTMA